MKALNEDLDFNQLSPPACPPVWKDETKQGSAAAAAGPCMCKC